MRKLWWCGHGKGNCTAGPSQGRENCQRSCPTRLKKVYFCTSQPPQLYVALAGTPVPCIHWKCVSLSHCISKTHNIKIVTVESKNCWEFISCLSDMILFTFPSYSRTQLVSPQQNMECCIHHWDPQHRKDMDQLEWVLRRDTKLIRGMKQLSYKERLRELG